MRLVLALLICTILIPLPQQTAQAATNPEIRAFWVDAFHDGFKTPQQIEQLVHDAEFANMNTLIVQVRRRGDAYYQSNVEPRSNDPSLAPAPFDPLRMLIDTAHARDIEVHAWIAALPVWGDNIGNVPDDHILNYHSTNASGDDDWIMRSIDGDIRDSEKNIWLDPGHPAVIDYTEAVVRDLLVHYPEVDGIHLDRIRYPSIEFGYNPTAVARFNARFGRTGKPEPSDPLWTEWRRKQVTALVRRVMLTTVELAPHARVSAAVIAWGDGPTQMRGWERSTPYKQALQDWRLWLQQRLIDTAIVMNYDREYVPQQQTYFNNWLEWQTASGRGPVVVGVAGYLNSVDDTIAQIKRAQQTGARGVAIYSYAVTNKDEQARRALLQALRDDPFSQPAPMSPMDWKEVRGALQGTLQNVDGVAADSTVVIITGPETRFVMSNASGWFGAPGLTPGTYTALIRLHGDEVLWSQIEVSAGAVTEVQQWTAGTLSPREQLLMMLRPYK
ncbi:MAG: family 10 glycosylhydrolase [Chloroflexota bacterium]